MLTLAIMLFFLCAAGYILVLAFGPLGDGSHALDNSSEQSAKHDRD